MCLSLLLLLSFCSCASFYTWFCARLFLIPFFRLCLQFSSAFVLALACVVFAIHAVLGFYACLCSCVFSSPVFGFWFLVILLCLFHAPVCSAWGFLGSLVLLDSCLFFFHAVLSPSVCASVLCLLVLSCVLFFYLCLCLRFVPVCSFCMCFCLCLWLLVPFCLLCFCLCLCMRIVLAFFLLRVVLLIVCVLAYCACLFFYLCLCLLVPISFCAYICICSCILYLLVLAVMSTIVHDVACASPPPRACCNEGRSWWVEFTPGIKEALWEGYLHGGEVRFRSAAFSCDILNKGGDNQRGR